jgi:succinoglycan biosynthesis transport protein ExoP
MSLNSFLRILRARWLTIASIALVAIFIAAVITFQTPRSYTATTEMIVDGSGQDPISGQSLPSRMIAGYIATQADVIRSRIVAQKVIDQNDLINNPAVLREFRSLSNEQSPSNGWLLNYLHKRVAVTPRQNSTVMDISFNSRDPELSAQLADAFAVAFIQTNLELRTDPAKQVTGWYNQQLSLLRDTLVEKQNTLSSYREEHGILATTDRFDLETAKLSELSSMLVAAQGLRLDSQSRSQQIAGSTTSDLPAHVLENPQIQRLSTELAQAQARLTDAGARLGSNHPLYRQANREVTALRGQLNQALKLIGGNLRSTAELAKAREEQLQVELAEQKEQVMKLSRIRNELNLLQQEVDTAQMAYDAALARSTQTRMESQSALTDVAILNTASVPSRPTHPKTALNLILAAAFGLLLGTAFALCREWMDRRVRGADELEARLGIPVLACIPPEHRRWSKRELVTS